MFIVSDGFCLCWLTIYVAPALENVKSPSPYEHKPYDNWVFPVPHQIYITIFNLVFLYHQGIKYTST